MALFELAQLPAGGFAWAAVGPGEGVEGVALGRGREKRLVLVLPMKVDEAVTEFCERGHRRHLPVDVASRAAVGRDDPSQDDLDFLSRSLALLAGRAGTGRRPRSDLRPPPPPAPGRTRMPSARPPSSNSIASTTRVLPAPVSP